MADAAAAWDTLDEAWRVAFTEAWTSWCGGSAGVGAVVTDASGEILTTGRNRIVEARHEAGVLAGTFLAHAEMNALAVLPLRPGGDLTISTTFEPCLMCASTILQLRIGHVRYAAADPLFDGMHDWLGALPFSAARRPERLRLGGPLGAFAHVLHLSWIAFWDPESDSALAHRALAPDHADVAARIVSERDLARVADGGGSVLDATTCLWDDLERLA